MKCGLLGRKLGHSYSPQIHNLLGNYSYTLFEKEPNEIEDFLRNGDFTGINVTIPYKTAVIPYLDELSPLAKHLGAVNTIVRKDGRLIGHNTDHFGFETQLKQSGLQPANKKCLVLGTGGASRPVCSVLECAGGNVVAVSHQNNHPNFLAQHSDAAIIVNTTPVGMFPNVEVSPIDLAQFPKLEGVLDVIFNPARTALMLQAEAMGIVAMGGLWMLVAQAKESAEWFLNAPIAESEISRIHGILQGQTKNIVLIGMPGCGKSTVGKHLAEQLHRPFIDSDAIIEQRVGKTIPEIFAEKGELFFRHLETEVLTELGSASGCVIATGGGCVTRPKNYNALHRNGTIFYLQRNLSYLPTDGRPLSLANSPESLFTKRKPLYEQFADHIIDNNGDLSTTLNAILKERSL